MFKVLLADDEPWILAGLQASVDWAAEGYEMEHYENAGQLLDDLESEPRLREEADGEDVSIVAYLTEHFQEDLTLDAVSRELSMSASSVRRLLQRESGKSFQHCLVALRMEHACALLRECDLSINEVAYSSGFHDALYFRRAFKKCFGLTPSEYRAQRDKA